MVGVLLVHRPLLAAGSSSGSSSSSSSSLAHVLQPVFLLAWAWMSTVMMVSVLALCSWHRRRMQRRREGLPYPSSFACASTGVFVCFLFFPLPFWACRMVTHLWTLRDCSLSLTPSLPCVSFSSSTPWWVSVSQTILPCFSSSMQKNWDHQECWDWGVLSPSFSCIYTHAAASVNDVDIRGKALPGR
jgi:hypothetical protein